MKAAGGMAADIDGVMNNLAHDMQTALPTDFDVMKSAVSGASGLVRLILRKRGSNPKLPKTKIMRKSAQLNATPTLA